VYICIEQLGITPQNKLKFTDMKTQIKNIENLELREKVINTHKENTYKAAPKNEVLEMECEMYECEEGSLLFVPANKYTGNKCFAIMNNSDFAYGEDAEELREEIIDIINE